MLFIKWGPPFTFTFPLKARKRFFNGIKSQRVKDNSQLYGSTSSFTVTRPLHLNVGPRGAFFLLRSFCFTAPFVLLAFLFSFPTASQPQCFLFSFILFYFISFFGTKRNAFYQNIHSHQDFLGGVTLLKFSNASISFAQKGKVTTP